MQQTSRLPHVVRGSAAAFCATFVALLSHVSAGGEMPGLLGVVVPLALSLFVSVLLAGRRLSVIRLGVSVIASQTLFHSLFVLGTEQAGMVGGSGHQHFVTADALPAPFLSDATVTLLHGDALMWASHGLGAVATVVFLTLGERTLDALRSLTLRTAQWLRHALVPAVRPVLIAAPIRAPRIATARWTVLDELRAFALHRRGPPCLAGFAA
ncbi:hypothetical protein ICL81_06730 [Leucobacter sp. cx-328]|uniref:hypothetical protein n=1 Tax=unclassified Leucobacter TaxID=2621730 RepID=UPI00165D6670|nr:MULTISPECIES: hypothetical protein [unclassified Leucobacter]MBC9944202.1 hypothetical protein [Leucobacter sp. cx-328]